MRNYAKENSKWMIWAQVSCFGMDIRQDGPSRAFKDKVTLYKNANGIK